MSASIFDNKHEMPNGTMLVDALGETNRYFNRITSFIRDEYGELTPEWKFYGQKAGWSMKLMVKRRNVLFVVPCEGYFNVQLIFGDKAVEQILADGFPESIKQQLQSATKYVEGRGIQLEIRTPDDSEVVVGLIKVKMTPK
jgi:hypothetical protein